MTNEGMAEKYFRQEKARMELLKTILEKQQWPIVVSEAQECLELLTRAALRYVGIEPPKWHDVGEILERNKGRFPAWFQERIDEVVRISSALRGKRELSFYGDEEDGKSPYDLFYEQDAQEAFAGVETIYNLCERLLEKILNKDN
jgi:HEPN domain-containing protein